MNSWSNIKVLSKENQGNYTEIKLAVIDQEGEEEREQRPMTRKEYENLRHILEYFDEKIIEEDGVKNG